MSSSSLLVTVLGMFCVTYFIRVGLFITAQKATMPVWLESALKYVPVAVLTAIIMPMMVLQSGQLAVSLENPWLLGGLVSFFVGLVIKNQLLTIVFGVFAFFAAKFLLG
ncbi:AzlD domain-containing protein [Marinomonas balearica]|uniref:Branched-subunit amino acid transport protein n=1 Tax=Marinomonas balearica TaxID=491947 RepID=A0A4R6MEI2_9GAMM|nr:AzlD domain-containing protein [Marinomonas balearica]TDP00015.1 branched-subunit amino acid transport protein [Marinomonas balearica]